MSFYSFVTRESFGESYSQSKLDSAKTSINWVMPPPAPESGGHINIFRFLRGLSDRGYDCRVVICNDGIGNPTSENPDTIYAKVNEWYGEFRGQVCYANSMPSATITMATGWQTAYVVKQFRSTAHKGYFVQDFEPSFYPVGAESLFAEDTYRFGFTGFTAGSWLSNLLKSKYGMKAYPVSFSYDMDLYRPYPRNDPDVTHLLCYVRPTTERRGWEIVNQALALVHKVRPDVRFILVGGEVDKSQCHYPAFNPGSVKLTELGPLYSQCHAALILSCTNLSLLPLEVMACGVPIISNTGDNVEWLLNSQNAILSAPNPMAVAKTVIDVLNLPEERHNRLVAQSIAFARRTNWDHEFDKIAKAIVEMTRVQHPQPVAA